MRLVFPECTYTLDDIVSGKINQKNHSETESDILLFVRKWIEGQSDFEFGTSGTTGSPKIIELSRNQLTYSAQTTLKYLFADVRPKRLLLCIPHMFVGGRQVIIRALLSNADLIIESPSSNPLNNLNVKIDLVSLVPLQIENILDKNPEKFDLIDTVLIGGAPLNESLTSRLKEIKGTRFFETYGMTETASHVALRKVSEKWFQVMGDAILGTDDRDCLKIKGTITNQDWIQTNDVVEMNGSNEFRWLGRADFTINSGGIKVQPEELEYRIRELFPDLVFAISSTFDESLGEKIVLITTSPILNELNAKSGFNKYEFPKEELIVSELPISESGKLNRLKLRELANSR